MSNGRVQMHTSSSSVPYVKFDGYISYKPTKGIFSVYISETKEVTEVKSIAGALITRRNIVTATSMNDKIVTSQDFDGFDEKLFFKENCKGGKLVAKDLTYSQVSDDRDRYFAQNSFRLGSAIYIVTEKGSVLKLVLNGTTRSKVNDQLDALSNIDYVTFTAADETVTVGKGSRSQSVYEITTKEESKDYSREAVNKINDVVNTLKDILKYKKTGKVEQPVTEDEVAEVFSDVTVDDLPL